MSAWLKIQTFHDPELEKMVLSVVQWCWDIQNAGKPHWLSILGTFGTGKTHCARQVFRWLGGTRRLSWNGWGATGCPWDYDPYLVHWPTHLTALRAGKATLRNEDMVRWPFLILDEITVDADRWGPAANALVNLLSARAGKWVLITSNCGMADLEAMDGRIASRLIRDGSRVCMVETKDFSTR